MAQPNNAVTGELGEPDITVRACSDAGWLKVRIRQMKVGECAEHCDAAYTAGDWWEAKWRGARVTVSGLRNPDVSIRAYGNPESCPYLKTGSLP